jgi:hypothetical protein
MYYWEELEELDQLILHLVRSAVGQEKFSEIRITGPGIPVMNAFMFEPYLLVVLVEDS